MDSWGLPVMEVPRPRLVLTLSHNPAEHGECLGVACAHAGRGGWTVVDGGQRLGPASGSAGLDRGFTARLVSHSQSARGLPALGRIECVPVQGEVQSRL